MFPQVHLSALTAMRCYLYGSQDGTNHVRSSCALICVVFVFVSHFHSSVLALPKTDHSISTSFIRQFWQYIGRILVKKSFLNIYQRFYC